MAKKPPMGQLNLMAPVLSTAPCVPAVREGVAAWRAAGTPGVSPTTRLLLAHWFETEHRLPTGGKFSFHAAQRKAVETLVWLYEVEGVRRQKDLVERFTTRRDLRLLQHDAFPRYALKMATGSGKTMVLALTYAWQFFNATAEGRADFATTALLVAPNVIVFERLKSDFEHGRLFRWAPIVPPALRTYWDVEFYVRGDAERTHAVGAFYLTNVQQLYPAETAPAEPDPMAAIMGPRPTGALATPEPFAARVARRSGPVLVMNDEAHHTHDEESAWNHAIRDLHAALAPDPAAPGDERGVVQLDVSATPRHAKGTLFTWTVYDYPLKQAIIDGVVKRPVKGLVTGIQEQPSDLASVRYRAHLTAGVERWKEYRDALARTDRKPVLFVMLHVTKDADEVADYLRKAYPADFGGEGLLVVHTNRQGEVSTKDLDAARRAARDIDDGASPVNAIVSVLMLREGWDVQSVTVVVGLRPYSSTANILPEQTVGRGLRLMFRGETTGYRERVDVIGNKAFMEFVERLEKEEDLDLDTFTPGKDRLVVETVFPEAARAAYDIAVPQLSAILTRKRSLAEQIAGLDLAPPVPPLPVRRDSPDAQTFRYEGRDILTLEREIEREYALPEPQTSQEVVSYYAKLIAQDLKLPSQFASLVPRVRAWLLVAFSTPVELDTPEGIRAIAQPLVAHVVRKEFARALRPLLIEEQMPEVVGEARPLSETPGFPWTRPTTVSVRTVFNLVACDNQFERAFADFLDGCAKVARFAKLPERFGFSIPYTDAALRLRYYEPDFVAVLADGAHFLLETKGREDLDVQHKDRAAEIWCEHATVLSGTPWTYKKVPQAEFERLRPERFEDLLYFG